MGTPEAHCRTAQDDRRLGEVLVCAQAGDKASYAKLLAECEPLLRRSTRSAGVQDDIIDDVIRDALMTMHDARQTYDPSRSFSAWLGAIARCRAIDALRRSLRPCGR